MAAPLGDFINGQFVQAIGAHLQSINPARDGEPVLATQWNADHVDLACAAAADAQPGWAQLSRTERWRVLVGLSEALHARRDELADAIVLETGKIRSEAISEVETVVSRFRVVKDQVDNDLREGGLPGFPSESTAYHALGVVGVIGPYNNPVHHCNARLVPALLLGNTVVVKPSEVTPLSMQCYFQAVAEAGLPRGVLNMVHGKGPAGAALVANKNVRGLCFTGSQQTGLLIAQTAATRPELLTALEMGGKNTAIVLEDAEMRQAVHEIILGGYLTTGQRATATSRVLVHKTRQAELLAALADAVPKLHFGDPEDPTSFAGPLTTLLGVERLEQAIVRARAAGAEVIVPGGRQEGGWYIDASVHLLPEGCHSIRGYTDTELFGPDLCIETIHSLDEAIEVLDSSSFGFANAVFTSSECRFEEVLRRTHSGILNWNRTTNLASPRLPFGGVAQSGNYRPAGAHSPRNLAYPVAIIKQILGEVRPHELLADVLPTPDLAALEARHTKDEAMEAEGNWSVHQRPMGMRHPDDGVLPTSQGWLDRLYAGGRMVREKKPLVFDHLRSAGPWMVSVDDNPLAVLDGMSQTATHPAGFNADDVVAGYFDGAFGDSLCRATHNPGQGDDPAEAFRIALRPRLAGGLKHITFTSSGTEANEKALALCRANGPHDATRVLAFEGSFHGRSLLALHATWNPTKREPFEIAGYEARFAPFPVWLEPGTEPEEPDGFRERIAAGEVQHLLETCPDEDELLRSELESLLAVEQALHTGDVFACIIEPMQSEGGDRYATARFFRGLRLLTRYHGVPLVFDEVQTGFGLGGTFFWNTRFGLVDNHGKPDGPDAVAMAKRAQLGVVASCFEDPEPTQAHAASLVRGRIHISAVGNGENAREVQALCQPRLEEMARRFPELVGHPRCTGYAFAFDLPSSAQLGAYIGQRFWRGAIVFGAGTRTIRYRLNSSFGPREIELLFETIKRSLAWLVAHPGQTPPAWEASPTKPKPIDEELEVRIRRVGPEDANEVLPLILALEEATYEPARRDPEAKLRKAFLPDGLVHIAELRHDEGGWRFVGCSLAAPLEEFDGVPGPAGDPHLGLNNTLYSMAITLSPEARGLGFGKRLKLAQIQDGSAQTTASGERRYQFITGRNRVDQTDVMTHVNRQVGAQVVEVLEAQYGENDAKALYYRIPLAKMTPGAKPIPAIRSGDLDLASGVVAPFGDGPQSLKQAQADGLLYGPAVNKITVLNYVTPAAVRAVEYISAHSSKLRHLFLTNSRSEIVDKALRICRWHRQDSETVIGLAGGYVGHTTAAARSISDVSTHRQGSGTFDWPKVLHPAEIGSHATINALDRVVKQAGGPDSVFGFVLEYCQERTGLVPPDSFWPLLASWRRETGIPVLLFESATSCYRSGLGGFASNALSFVPDLLCWFGGGQVGFIHTGADLFVDKPLAMASTWDGDELSLIRIQHHLRASRELDLAPAIDALDVALAKAVGAGCAVDGLGLYRVIQSARAGEIADALARQGLVLGRLPGDRLVVAPPLDTALEAAEHLAIALDGAL